MFGLVKSLLPPQLGIYRLGSGRHDQVHHAPNFQVWVDHLPRRSRVIILALSPLTRLDGNAALDLKLAVERLAGEDRKLVLAGVKPAHYKALDEHDAIETIGAENLCPDLEFAVARGIDLARELSPAPAGAQDVALTSP